MVRSVTIAAAALLTLAWAAAGSAEIREGFWEITTTSEMKGVPVQLPPTTMKQCITKKDLIPKSEIQEPGHECRIKDQKISGDTVTYMVECKDQGGNIIEISGKTIYKGNVFNGVTNTTVKTKEQGTLQMTSTTSGKYTGPCPK